MTQTFGTQSGANLPSQLPAPPAVTGLTYGQVVRLRAGVEEVCGQDQDLTVQFDSGHDQRWLGADAQTQVQQGPHAGEWAAAGAGLWCETQVHAQDMAGVSAQVETCSEVNGGRGGEAGMAAWPGPSTGAGQAAGEGRDRNGHYTAPVFNADAIWRAGGQARQVTAGAASVAATGAETEVQVQQQQPPSLPLPASLAIAPTEAPAAAPATSMAVVAALRQYFFSLPSLSGALGERGCALADREYASRNLLECALLGTLLHTTGGADGGSNGPLRLQPTDGNDGGSGGHLPWRPHGSGDGGGGKGFQQLWGIDGCNGADGGNGDGSSGNTARPALERAGQEAGEEARRHVFLNTHEPFCLAAVGVQGGGKSHT